MNILFLTLADFGKLKNLKTAESLAVMNSLGRLSTNLRVICRDHKAFERSAERAMPLGRLPLFFLEALVKYISLQQLSSRYLAALLLDVFSSRKINQKYDLLFMLPPFYVKSLQKVKKNGGITVVYGGTGHPANTFKLNRRFNIKTNEAYDRRMMECIDASDYVIARSDFVRETYVDNGYPKDRIYVTYPGIDTDRFNAEKRIRSNDNTFRIVCVANYGLLKGYQYLFQAWAELELDNAELVIVGKPTSKKMAEITKFYAKNLNNFRNIGFADSLSFYQSADLFVHPSLTEGAARVVYEAMACGLPVICTSETGSAVRDNKEGFIVPSEDVVSLKEKIMFFYNHPEKMKEMGRAARQRILDHYTWDHFTERVYLALNDICERSGIKKVDAPYHQDFEEINQHETDFTGR